MEIELYEIDGKTPVADFIKIQDAKMYAKILRTIQLLENHGPLLREPFSKHLSDGIYELRINIGNNATRILYFFFHGGRAILTNGFVKKTQKTPKKEIELAKFRRNEYLNR